jgi:hypothetical protein
VAIADETRREPVADMKPGVLSTLGVLLLVAGLAPAQAERVSPCKTIRAEGAAILQLCGGARLRSFALSMQGLFGVAVMLFVAPAER